MSGEQHRHGRAINRRGIRHHVLVEHRADIPEGIRVYLESLSALNPSTWQKVHVDAHSHAFETAPRA